MSQSTPSTRMSHHQARYVWYVTGHPGCTVADVDRACRANPQAGHKWVYDGVSRLCRRGLLLAVYRSGRKHLFAPGTPEADMVRDARAGDADAQRALAAALSA